MSFYPPKTVAEMTDALESLHSEADDVRLKFFRILHLFKTDAGRELVSMGFIRRLRVLQRVAEQVFRIAPPERTNLLTEEERTDIEINVQAFFVSASGALDNLAGAWVHETGVSHKGRPLPPSKIGMGPNYKQVRASLPPDVQKRLADYSGWFEFQDEFRHGVAHRLPLYIPPYGVSPKNVDRHNQLSVKADRARRSFQFDEFDRLENEQRKLGHYIPMIGHRPGSGTLVLHPTIIANARTVLTLGDMMADKFQLHWSREL